MVWIKWPVYIVAGIFIFLGITQLVECFGADASNKFAGIFTPFIVAAVTIYLSNRQHNIADAQRAVAEESKNIAAANRDIADRKLKLELFDKRYEVYNSVISFYSFSLSLNKRPSEYIHGPTMALCKKYFFNIEHKNKLNEALDKAKKDRIELEKQYEVKIISIQKARFIFDEKTFYKFDEIISESYKIGKIYNDDAIKQLENIIGRIGKEIVVHRNEHNIEKSDISSILNFETYMTSKIHIELSKYLDISKI